MTPKIETKREKKQENGANLMTYALAQGITLDTIALVCGVSHTTVQSWRRGDRPIRTVYKTVIHRLILNNTLEQARTLEQGE
ncbi:MAG: hypothetical protein ACYDBH_12335 [Acidobacteriaceae bacterium]